MKMIKIFSDLGITEEEYEDLIEQNKQIETLDEDEIIEMINLLKAMKCSDEIIKNTILSDVFYLTRIKTDIQKTVLKLNDIGLTSDEIVDLIDGYPYILEKDDFEITEFVNSKRDEGLSKEEICELILSNPSIIDE